MRVWEGKKLVFEGKADAKTAALRDKIHRELFKHEQNFQEISKMTRLNLRFAGLDVGPPTLVSTNAEIQAEVKSRLPQLENKRILVIGGTDSEAFAWGIQNAHSIHIQPTGSDVECIHNSLMDADAVHGNAEEKLDELEGKFDAVVSKSVLQRDVVSQSQLKQIIEKSREKADLHVHLISTAAPGIEAFLKSGWRVVEKTSIHGPVKLIVMERLKKS